MVRLGDDGEGLVEPIEGPSSKILYFQAFAQLDREKEYSGRKVYIKKYLKVGGIS